jgi:hypothetical protein
VIGNMIEFWRRRHPDIDDPVMIAPGCDISASRSW